MNPVDTVLSKLQGIKPSRSRDKWMAWCPSHTDHRASLSILSTEEGKVLLNCFAGCDTEDILSALGLSWPDLFPKDDSPTSSPPRGKPLGTQRYVAKDWEGTPAAVHVRRNFEGGDKQIWWQGLNGANGLGGRSVNDLPLYGSHQTPRHGEMLVIVEGEKARDALAEIDVFALGTYGADHRPGKAVLLHLMSWTRIYLWPDRDRAGFLHMRFIAEQLLSLGHQGVFIIMDPDAAWKDDAADWIERGGTPEGLKVLCAEAMSAEEYLADGELESPTISVASLDDQAPSPQWPEPLDGSAFYGLAGAIVEAIDPTTEADPAAVLANVLICTGSAVGSRPHWAVSGKKHGLRLNAALVGETSKGRKGTSMGSIKPLFQFADPGWTEKRIVQGLSTGEGLIWSVRDPIMKREPIREKRQVVGNQEVEDDPGVSDKRLLATEEEFASTLRMMGRDGNTLSAVIRQAWDGGDLRTLTKNSPAQATDAHISIVGHITQDELVRELTSTEAANGFANRFLWLCVRRSKQLPDGGQLSDEVVHDLGTKLRSALEAGRRIDLITRDSEANEIWREIYGSLSSGQPGLIGAILGRAEAQVMRLAAIYAVLDETALIRRAHLEAAIAVWEYCERSVEYIFGDRFGDPVADTILNALRRNGPLSRTDIRDLFKRHRSAARIDDALNLLERAGKARSEKQSTGGRDREIWYAI